MALHIDLRHGFFRLDLRSVDVTARRLFRTAAHLAERAHKGGHLRRLLRRLVGIRHVGAE